MAADFLIKGGLDLSGIRQELKAFAAEQTALQSKAAAVAPATKIPVLPPSVLQRIDKPIIGQKASLGQNTAEINKAITAQAKLIALQSESNRITALASGQKYDPIKGTEQLRLGTQAAFRAGGVEFGKTQAKFLDAEFQRFITQFEAVSSRTAKGQFVPVSQQAERFAKLTANPILQQQGLLNANGNPRIFTPRADTQDFSNRKDALAIEAAYDKERLAAKAEQLKAEGQVAAEKLRAAQAQRVADGKSEGIDAEILAARQARLASEASLAASASARARLAALNKDGTQARVDQIPQAARLAGANQFLADTRAKLEAMKKGTVGVTQSPILNSSGQQPVTNNLSPVALRGTLRLEAAMGQLIQSAEGEVVLGQERFKRRAAYNSKMAALELAIAEEVALEAAQRATLAGRVSQASFANPKIGLERGIGEANLIAGEASAKALRGGIINANPELQAQLANAEARYIEIRLRQVIEAQKELLASGVSTELDLELSTLKKQLGAMLLRAQAGDEAYLSATNQATLAKAEQAAATARQLLTTPGAVSSLGGDQAAVTRTRNAVAAAELAQLELMPGNIESLRQATTSRLRMASSLNLSIIGDQEALEATLAAATTNRRKAIATNELIVADAASVEAIALETVSRTKVSTAANQLSLTMQSSIEAFALGKITQDQLNLAIRQEVAASRVAAKTTYDTALLKAEATANQIALDQANGNALALQRQANIRAVKSQTAASGIVGGFKATENAGGRDAGAFLGGGLATTLKFALPSAVLFGAFAGIKNAVKDTEELAITFTKLESQLNGLDDVDRLANLKKQILDISSETGIAAAEIGDLALQIQGAFGDLEYDPNKLNDGGLKGSDNITRYGDEVVAKQIEAAGKLSVVTGIAQKELVDGLTAASFAFGTSADRIGDVAAKLEVSTGVKAKETISFLGDIGPVAEAAGFSLEEFAAIAAIAQKRSGATGTVLAEQFGRIIPAITKNSQDFFNIANKNQSLFEQLDGGKGYTNFIKAIQNSDTKEIFRSLSGSFDQLDKGSREFVIQLLGGRREANALLSVFNDTKGLDKATKEAENSAGVLDERFAALQKRITVIFRKLSVEFTKLAKTFVDSGIGKAIGLSLKELEVMLKVTNGIFSIFTKIDKLTGGWASNLAAVAIQMKVITTVTKALIGQQALAAATAAGSTGGSRAGAAISSIPLIAGVRSKGFFPNSREAYRQSLLKTNIQKGLSPTLNSKSSFLAQGAGSLGVAKASGRGLYTAIGGATGVGFLAAAGIFGAYQTFTDKVEKDKTDITKLQVNLSKDKRSTKDIFEEAKKLKVKESLFYRFWRGLNDLSTDSELTEIEALIREAKSKTEIGSKVASSKTGQRLTAQLVRGTKKTPKESVFSIADGESIDLTKKYTKGNSAKDNSALALQKIRDRINLRNKTVSGEVANVLLKSEDIYGDLQDLRESNSADPKLVKEINAVLAAIQSSGLTDSEYSSYANDVTQPIRALAKSTSETINGDLKAAKEFFEDRRVSLETYVEVLRKTIADLKKIKIKTPGQEEAIRQANKDINSAVTSTLLDRQERDLEVFKLLGASDEEVNQKESLNALSNLRNPDFVKDPEARRKAALSLLENTREYYENIVKNTDDLALAQKLINEGFDIPEEVRFAIQKLNIEDSSQYQDLAESVRALNKGEKTKGLIGKGPGGLLDKVLKDFMDDGIVSEDTIKYLGQKQDALKSKLQDKSLSEADRANIVATMELISELLNLAPDSYTVRTDDNGKKIKVPTKGDGKAFGVDMIAEKAKLDKEVAKEAADDAQSVADSAFELQKIRMNGNAKAIAILEKAQANAKLLKAQTIEDANERAIAINEALGDILQADQAFADAIQAETEARYGLAKARATDAGDTVGAAQANLAAAQAALNAANAKDPSGADALNAQAAVISARREISDAQKAQRDSARELFSFVAADEDPVKEAQYALDDAKLALNEARGQEARNKAALEVKQRERALRDAQRGVRDSMVALFRAVVTGEDPVAQAKFDLSIAKSLEGEAKGKAAQADAALRTLEAQRTLRDAMQAAQYSVYTLRQAQLQSLDDDVGAANVAAALARQQLKDAIASKSGTAEINSLRAASIAADKSARDTLFQTKLDDYQYLLDTGKITKTQYIAYLTALQQTLSPASKQFKELEKTLRNLKNDIGSDLQANLPTTLALPTLYEVRRLNQTGKQPGAGTNQIGYQDNRKIDLKIEIGQNMSEAQIVRVLSDALGVGRNSNTPSRY